MGFEERSMKGVCLVLAGIVAAILTAGCAPGIVVLNNAPFTVRAILIAGSQSQVLSPSAGGSSYAERRQRLGALVVIGKLRELAPARAHASARTRTDRPLRTGPPFNL